MKIRFLSAVVSLIACAASLLASGCASQNSTGGGISGPGYYDDSNTYSPLPMNQAARTDAMRQAYRNEFR